MAGKASFGSTVAALTRQGRPGEAVRLVEAALRKSPRDVTLLTTLAQLHNRGTGRYDLALKAAETALARAPRAVPALLEAAQAAANLHDYPAAEARITMARKIAPDNVDALYVLASIQHRIDRFDDEVQTLETALALRPDHLQSRLQHATALKSAGRLDEAADKCREIFAEVPDSLSLYGVYTTATKVTAEDPLYLHLRDRLLPRLTTDRETARARKLLAKMEEDIGNPDGAFALMTRANREEGLRFDRARYAAFVTAQTGLTRADYFGGGGSQDDTPVLIVGMPRSGSTLLEQVLTRHPQIGGVGESPALRDIVLGLQIKEHDGRALVGRIRGLGQADAAALGQRYLDVIRSRAGEMPRIVDKKLHNFEYLGLFARLFPRARILHARRDPMDTCVSCYMQRLTSWHSYTRDLGDLGWYYGQYRRLMDHWQTALPNPVMAVDYEDMVSDTEATTRRVLDFLGMEWDPACLDHVGGKQVRTASIAQVRQPIYRTSVEKWRRYDAHLGPLKAELSRFYEGGLD